MRLYDLTQEQCNMLDAMWDKNSADELYDWFLSLNDEKFQMALVLHEMLLQEVWEQNADPGYTTATNMLKNIGVNI